MDGAGNMAIGYNASSAAINPGIRYNTRMANDPLNTLSGGEATMIAGSGSQGSGNGNRWGDYNGIAADPSNARVIWFYSMYASAVNTWGTWIGSAFF